MLKALRVFFGAIVVVLAGYGLMTDTSASSGVMRYTQFFLGAMMLVTGASALQEKRKERAVFFFLLAGGIFLALLFLF